MTTTETFLEYVQRRFGGLFAGSHPPDGKVCALEAWSQYCQREWTGQPATLGTWDLRPINDIDVPESVRTPALCRLVEAYAGCREWPRERQTAVAERLVLLTVQRLISELEGLPPEVAASCREARTLQQAAAAAAWAWAAAARVAARAAAAAAAAAAATAAEWAAESAASKAAARERVFLAAVAIWEEAAS